MFHVVWFTVAVAAGLVLGFDNNRNDNLAVYWGTDSYGATHPSDSGNWQKPLAFYCGDNSIDAFPMAFLNVFFSTGGLPSIDLANTCNPSTNAVFAGTNLPNCQFLASDIQTCQTKGKIVTLSLGGGAGGGSFTSASQAQAFGTTIWNLFLGGSSNTRPFGAAVLDGIDLDIEGGSTDFFDSFISQIRSLASGSSKHYYFTAAPQCPFPDAYLGTVLNAASFDAIYVQFYNNFCSLPNFNNPTAWNFADWDTWAKTKSINKNVKIYIGAPAAPTAAGSGYVDAATLGNILRQTRSTYSSFGGVMMWDASQAYQNNRYDAAIKAALISGGSSPPPSTTSKTTSTTSNTTTPTTSNTTTSKTTTSSTSTAHSGSCAGVPAWTSGVAYTGGLQVVYNGHLWTANWWSQADVPGGSSGDWKDDGPCTDAKAAATVASLSVASNHATTMWATPKPSTSSSGDAGPSAIPRAPLTAKATDTATLSGNSPIYATHSRFFRI